MCNFKIGDVVEIINYRKTYENFYRKFNSLNFNNKKKNYTWGNGERGVVFGITKHNNWYDCTLIALQHEDGRQCLIDKNGVKLISNRKPFKLKRNE